MRNATQFLKTALTDVHWYSFEIWLRVYRYHLLEVGQPLPAIPLSALGPLGSRKESVGSNDTPVASGDGSEI